MDWADDHDCPLVKRVITDRECMNTALYAEGDKEFDPMPDAITVPGYEAICFACPHYKN